MRVWDVSPGYLNRQSLLGEHREIHGLITILTQGREGYANHPETLRWKGHVETLQFRHEQVLTEMRLRNYRHSSPVEGAAPRAAWPDGYVDPPGRQYELLQGKYEGRAVGRIPLPRNPQELWAQHKYSVMARSYKLYKEIGPRVAEMRAEKEFYELADEMVQLLRHPPHPTYLRNTLMHMWGYVSGRVNPDFGATDPEEMSRRAPQRLLRIISMTALDMGGYLAHSTALSDLSAHMRIR